MTSKGFTYSYIVARTRNHVIGCENKMPWHLATDLRRFKNLTMRKPIIMGRKTFESIGRPLPGRPNIVVSRDTNFAPIGVRVAADKAEAMRFAQQAAVELGTREIMVIGGEGIFGMFEPNVHKVYLTEIQAEIDGDAFFRFDFSKWQASGRVRTPRSAVDDYETEYVVYERPTNRRSNGKFPCAIGAERATAHC